jgi:hypothetical protein
MNRNLILCLEPKTARAAMQKPAPSEKIPTASNKRISERGGTRQTPVAERALHVATIGLAVGATAFAAQMISDSNRVPTFAGSEHLMIFGRPATLAARRSQENPALLAANKNGIDYNPVGGLGNKDARKDLRDYSVIEANQSGALIKDPRGSLMRVSRGALVAGLGRIEDIIREGDRWAVVTPRGRILEAVPQSTSPRDE